jgi:hypothetical protein
MSAQDFDRSLHDFQHRSPFKPFTVEMVSGDRFQVDHPEALVFRGGVAVFVSKAAVPVIFDHQGVSQFLGEPMEQTA